MGQAMVWFRGHLTLGVWTELRISEDLLQRVRTGAHACSTCEIATLLEHARQHASHVAPLQGAPT
jgi:hypothetical protein